METISLSAGQMRGILIQTLEEIEGQYGTDFPVSSVILLLRIPTKGSISMSQLVKQSRLSPAGVSRSIATMAGFQKANRRLVDAPFLFMEDDPADRRYRVVGLTEAGRNFVDRISSIYTRYTQH